MSARFDSLIREAYKIAFEAGYRQAMKDLKQSSSPRAVSSPRSSPKRDIRKIPVTLEEIKNFAKGKPKALVLFHMDGCPHCVTLKKQVGLANSKGNDYKSMIDYFENGKNDELLLVGSDRVTSDIGVEGFPTIFEFTNGKQLTRGNREKQIGLISDIVERTRGGS